MMTMTEEPEIQFTEGTRRYIREEDVRIGYVQKQHWPKVEYHTQVRIDQLIKYCNSNPNSHIHQNELDRYQKAPEERNLQMAGEYTINVYVYGSYDLGFKMFDASRTEMNSKPIGDDGGKDVYGHFIDIKTSLIRGNLPASRYHLSITDYEKERDPNNILVLGLCPLSEFKPKEHILGTLLMGWCYAWEVDRWSPKERPVYGQFKDKWIRQAWKLHPMEHMPSELVRDHKVVLV